MQVSGIKPIVMGPQLKSIAAGGSSIPGKVAGLGRAAMMANFCNMVDEWVKEIKKHQGQGSAKDAADAACPASSIQPSPFTTYKRGADGKFSVQKIAAADVAMTLIQAIG